MWDMHGEESWMDACPQLTSLCADFSWDLNYVAFASPFVKRLDILVPQVTSWSVVCPKLTYVNVCCLAAPDTFVVQSACFSGEVSQKVMMHSGPFERERIGW